MPPGSNTSVRIMTHQRVLITIRLERRVSWFCKSRRVSTQQPTWRNEQSTCSTGSITRSATCSPTRLRRMYCFAHATDFKSQAVSSFHTPNPLPMTLPTPNALFRVTHHHHFQRKRNMRESRSPSRCHTPLLTRIEMFPSIVCGLSLESHPHDPSNHQHPLQPPSTMCVLMCDTPTVRLITLRGHTPTATQLRRRIRLKMRASPDGLRLLFPKHRPHGALCQRRSQYFPHNPTHPSSPSSNNSV